MRTIIVGDIHGCYREFCELLEKAEFNIESDRLVLLGDLIDRGPDSYGVLIEVFRLQALMKERCICLMGNHEDMAIEAYTSGDRTLWDCNHGSSTRKSFFKNDDRFQNYLGLIKKMPLYYENDSYICVHAGASIYKSVEDTRRDILLWDRDIAEGDKVYRGKLLIHGHTPVYKAEHRDMDGGVYPLPYTHTYIPLPVSGSINLDTGCVFGNTLTAMIVEEEKREFKLVQVSRRIGQGKTSAKNWR